MIQSKHLFSESSGRFHRRGLSESFWALKQGGWWCKDCVFSRIWGLLTTALLSYIAHPLILVCLELSLITRWDPYVSGLPEFGHQINWVIEHGGGVMELPSFRHFVKSWGMGPHGWHLKWGQFWDLNIQSAYSLPRFALRIKLPCGTPRGIWGIGCCSRDTTYLVSRKPKSLSPVLWELGWVLGQGVMKVGHCTQKLLPMIGIFRVPFRIGECINWVVTACILFGPCHPHAMCPPGGHPKYSSEQHISAAWVLGTFYES